MQNISSSQASAEVPINENFQILIHQEVYGKKQSTTTGLTWGYWGGRWAGFLIADGTLALTASATNYIVVLRSTGAISVSTAATNWNDTSSYQRVYQLTTNATAVTATEDHRAGQGGVHGGQGIAAADEFVNAQTGTAYSYVTADKGKLVTHSNAGAIAGTLPQAGASFPAGWWMDVQNTGAGTLTITPTTSTVDGAASLALTIGQGVRLVSSGANYFTQRGIGTNTASGISNTPAGNIAATTVQAAINELDAEKAALAGANFTGALQEGGKQTYNRGNVLGTVSQVAGVPTGALMEYGSNANGEYWRYAGGQQVCTGSLATTASIAANSVSVDIAFTLPASFVNGAFLVSVVAVPQSSNDCFGAIYAFTNTANSASFVVRNGATAQTFIPRFIAVGRWY